MCARYPDMLVFMLLKVDIIYVKVLSGGNIYLSLPALCGPALRAARLLNKIVMPMHKLAISW